MNQHIKSPLAFLTIGANSDLAKTDKVTGSAMYASAYSSKSDRPDNVALQHAISRKLSVRIINADVVTAPTTKTLLYNVANAVTQANMIGAVQAAYIVCGLPIVISSRGNVNLNALRRHEIDIHTVITDTTVLRAMPSNSNAVNTSPTCQLGRRDAYYLLYKKLKKLYGSCLINYYSFSQSYRCIKNKSKKIIDPPNLELDENGLITNAATFIIKHVSIS